MSWEQHERRAAVIDDVLAEVARTGDTRLSADALAAVEREFGDLGAFLAMLAQRWFTAFAARLDDALDRGAGADLAVVVAEAWTELAAARPGAHALLRAYGCHPVLAAALARQRRFLASLTGLDPAALLTVPGMGAMSVPTGRGR